MGQYFPLLLMIGFGVGSLLALLLVWQAAVALIRQAFAAHTPLSVTILLLRLAEATKHHRPWEPVLRGLLLELPWPWPWRLAQAADRLQAGILPAEILVTSRLLPANLRAQAAQALGQGPDVFVHWCMAITRRSHDTQFSVRQGSFLLAELAAVMGMMHFLLICIYPAFEKIMRELNITAPGWTKAVNLLITWEIPGMLMMISLAVGGWMLTLAWRWQRRRHQAAAYLLLAGSSARLPETVLGSAGDFTALCQAAGWTATTPVELARAVRQAELKESQREAWLPAMVAALAPILAAIPIGALVIGIMHLLLTILYAIETSS